MTGSPPATAWSNSEKAGLSLGGRSPFMPSSFRLSASISKNVLIVACTFIALFIFFLNLPNQSVPITQSKSYSFPSPIPPDHKFWNVPTQLADTQNATLGFEKLYVINLPERHDKRDALALAASLTNISLTFMDGIKGETIINKSLPLMMEDRKMPDNYLGSWRGHMNAIRHMVENNIGSAILMEDDLDWDIHIKGQMAALASGTRYLLNQSVATPMSSPYGSGWDILWLGHCHDALSKADPRMYMITDDPTTPSFEQYRQDNKAIVMKDWPPHARAIKYLGGAYCSYAYALSLQGAQKVLYGLSVQGLIGNFDNALSLLCEYGPSPGKPVPMCFSSQPTHFYEHRMKGGVGKNSDNVVSKKNDKSYTYNIRYSARLNIENLLYGNSQLIDQYPEGGPALP